MVLVASSLHLTAQLRGRCVDLPPVDLANDCWPKLIVWVASLADDRVGVDCHDVDALVSVAAPCRPASTDRRWTVGAASFGLTSDEACSNVNQISVDLLVFMHPYEGNFAGRYARPRSAGETERSVRAKVPTRWLPRV